MTDLDLLVASPAIVIFIVGFLAMARVARSTAPPPTEDPDA